MAYLLCRTSGPIVPALAPRGRCGFYVGYYFSKTGLNVLTRVVADELKDTRIEESSLSAVLGLEGFEHGGGSNNPGGFVVFEREQTLVTGHKKIGLGNISQREQKVVLSVRSAAGGRQVPVTASEVAQARGEAFGDVGAKPRPEEGPLGDIAEFREQLGT